MKPFDYAIATNREGALAALEKGYKPKAGGIDLIDMLKERIEPADRLVSLLPLRPENPIVRDGDGAFRIDALATLREVGAHGGLRQDWPAVAQSVTETATPQIRARATAGGNLLQRPRCWYLRLHEFPCLKRGGGTCYAVNGDNRFHALFGGGPCHIVHPSSLAPSLMAAGAQLEIESTDGSRRLVDAGGFFQLPRRNMYAENILEEHELLVSINLPPPAGARSGYVEFKEKQTADWPLASCAAVHREGAWRIVLGFAAPIPWRAEAAENVLEDTEDVSPELAERAADAALEGAQPMSGNQWRLRLVRASVRRAVLQACGKETT